MIWSMISRGGPMMYPLLIISVAVTALVVERCLYWRRVRRAGGEERSALLADARGHEMRIKPLGTIAVSLGLLGCTVGMVEAFASFQGSPDPDRLRAGLAVAYFATIAGLVSSIASMVACYFFNMMVKQYAPVTAAVPPTIPAPAPVPPPIAAPAAASPEGASQGGSGRA